MKVSILIPTRNAGSRFGDLLEALADQTWPVHEVLVIDSESSDGTPELARRHGVQVIPIAASSFDHGATRNALAGAADGDVFVFLTQDAVPADAHWLSALIAPLSEGEADASFARQLPRPGANPIEAFSRHHSYPAQPRRVTGEDVPRLGIWAYFFSNASSAIHRAAFENVGGFPTGFVMNEDLLFAARLLNRGGTIAYASAAKVVHSHPYGLRDTFGRYFDIGAVMSAARDELGRVPQLGSGTGYAGSLVRHLVREHAYAWLPLAIAETGAKAVGYALGRNVDLLPVSWRRRASLHTAFWERAQCRSR